MPSLKNPSYIKAYWKSTMDIFQNRADTSVSKFLREKKSVDEVMSLCSCASGFRISIPNSSSTHIDIGVYMVTNNLALI